MLFLRLLYLFLLISGTLNAQLREFSISDMPRPEVAVVQANNMFPDDALVLVYSAIEALEFRSSLGAIDKQTYNASASRYELLVKPVKQMLFAAKAGFIESKITTLNPNPKDVFYFKVEEKKEALASLTEPGILQISSEPLGADIFLNGVKITDKTPFNGEVNSGTTRVKIKKKKYVEFDTTINILSKTKVAISKTLKPTYLRFNIKSQPTGATVLLAGIKLGVTPFSREIDLSAINDRGLKNIQLVAAGYDTLNYEMNFEPASTPVELMFTLAKRQGRVKVTSIPAGADVFVDNLFKGHTPLDIFLDSGRFEVYVMLDDYQASARRYVEVSHQKTVEHKFVLTPIDFAEEADGVYLSMNEQQIGSQIWMSKNLSTLRFQNGDFIPEAKNENDWRLAGKNKQPAWCFYDYDPQNGEEYGKLYNWYAVADSRGLCPVGWFVPNDSTWLELMDYMGFSLNLEDNLMSSEPLSASTERNVFLSNLKGGFVSSTGHFMFKGESAYWWSSSTIKRENASCFTVQNHQGAPRISNAFKATGFSVRCLLK